MILVRLAVHTKRCLRHPLVGLPRWVFFSRRSPTLSNYSELLLLVTLALSPEIDYRNLTMKVQILQVRGRAFKSTPKSVVTGLVGSTISLA